MTQDIRADEREQEVLADLPLLPFSDALETAYWFRERGREDNIPECCIDEFTVDVLEGRYPAQLRGTLPNATGAYVPCSACRREADR